MGRARQDDLRKIAISRLRATGIVTAEMSKFVVCFGDVVVDVGLTHRHFPNGGSWSFFTAPCCGRRVRTLRLLDGAMVCRWCCIARGVRPRADPVSVKKRAEMRIPKLKAMLESEASLRLKPALYGKMERRSRMEAALREAEFRVAQSGIRKAKARAERIEDPCDEADFKPPRRPWPRLKSKSR